MPRLCPAILRSALAALALAFGLIGASQAAATITVFTMSDFKLSGEFGSVTASGDFTEGQPKQSEETSSVTVVLTQPTPLCCGTQTYTYTLSGPVDGAGWGPLQSQQPPSCFNDNCVGPLPATFHLDTVNPGVNATSASFEDDLQLYSGFGTVTETTMMSAPEPTAWVLMLLGFSALGAVLRGRRGGAAVVIAGT